MMLFPMAYQKNTADVAAKKPPASAVLEENTKQAGTTVLWYLVVMTQSYVTAVRMKILHSGRL